mgnify:CR=1 FL=1
MNIQELSQFNNACDELVSGKYILFDINPFSECKVTKIFLIMQIFSQFC